VTTAHEAVTLPRRSKRLALPARPGSILAHAPSPCARAKRGLGTRLDAEYCSRLQQASPLPRLAVRKARTRPARKPARGPPGRAQPHRWLRRCGHSPEDHAGAARRRTLGPSHSGARRASCGRCARGSCALTHEVAGGVPCGCARDRPALEVAVAANRLRRSCAAPTTTHALAPIPLASSATGGTQWPCRRPHHWPEDVGCNEARLLTPNWGCAAQHNWPCRSRPVATWALRSGECRSVARSVTSASPGAFSSGERG
jgi:hypothetical protein